MSQLTTAIISEIHERLEKGEPLDPAWRDSLFPPEAREVTLQYAGKKRREDVLSETMPIPFQRARTFGPPADFESDDWHNFLVWGDNLQAMRRLLEMKNAGRLKNADGSDGVRLIYIDPPFATKQEFRGNQDQKAYQDKVAGAEFIEKLRRRLILMHELLADDGAIFVHLDSKKAQYLKVVLDEIFGENNFRNEIILPGRASKNLQQQFETISRLNVRHDNLFWYSQSQKTRFQPLWIEKHNAGNPEGHWHHAWSNADRKTMRFELLGHTPSRGQWVWGKERALQAVESYERFLEEGGGRTIAEYWRDTGSSLRFIRPNPEDGSPQYWRAPATDRLADTVWSGIPIYSTQRGYPTEKHEALLSQIIELASGKGDIVMDAFMGSGTTCAVAEKLGRRWIGMDAGKLSIYTTQKRLLSLKKEIGNKGRALAATPFALYNAGHYDFASLQQLDRDNWRNFALQLFECQNKPHKINGVQCDGKKGQWDVIVFDHHLTPGIAIDEEWVEELHGRLGKKAGARFYIIAPRQTFDFQTDYLEVGDTRFYALRIPYSFIEELHKNKFTGLRQPNDDKAMNDLLEAVGFDFIETPDVKFVAGCEQESGRLIPDAKLEISSFESKTKTRNGTPLQGFEALAMVLVDLDFDGKTFDLDKTFYPSQLRHVTKNDDGSETVSWKAVWPLHETKASVGVIWIDIHGNESFRTLSKSDFEGEII